jgi:sugar phosphate isomerase/epimerase
MQTIGRRAWLGSMAALPLAGLAAAGTHSDGRQSTPPRRQASVRISCNLYSFNAPLTSGALTLQQALDLCAGMGFDAVDPTGYYFTGYPEPPADAEIFRIKKHAFRLGLDISGTGVRNDFAQPDLARREADITLVKRWIEVAAKLGAPVLRIFAGRDVPAGHTEREAHDWVVESLEACIEHAGRFGVMIVLQNHNDLVKTARQTLAIRSRIASDWFGLNVDIGSLRTGDPYEEIARLAPFAYTWQIKELVYRQGREERVNLDAIVRIVRDAGYRGYLPIETLGAGDPAMKLRQFLGDVRAALARRLSQD